MNTLTLSEIRDILILGCTNGNSCLYIFVDDEPIVMGPIYELSDSINVEGYVNGYEIVTVDTFLHKTNNFTKDKPLTFEGRQITMIDDSMDHELRIDFNVN